MINENKVQSTVKAIKIADATIPTGYTLDKRGIAFVGDKAGVMLGKVDDETIRVDFSKTTEFTTNNFDETNTPTIGKKVYVNSANGKLTSVESGNKLVGFSFGVENGALKFHLV